MFFTLSHIISYFIAGIASYLFSKDMYTGGERTLDFLVDPSEGDEAKFTAYKVLPAQIVRGLLMSVVLYPVLGAIADLSFTTQFLFFTGLMYIYTDLSSAVPFPSNIEGQVYMKKRHLTKHSFLKPQIEIIIYSVIFGILVSLFAF
ncbi:hypothetical protein AMET1_1401 [Methanonatronarchaeum thermophilum]|uniref:Uncharacterized protein n=2 Tax=Methanonatronarchaeum thermophilum TaxID=1927129 RepID=A0A1Y3GE66_9EURY|nr:hypothetical protein AMET1_1401 [Methanonatronarchaeum thermophilum]